MIDSVGNEIQDSGAVIPKACQKCKAEFISEIKDIEIKQNIPFYQCKACDFNNSGSPSALDHKIENPTHEIIKIQKERVVGVNRIISGNKSIVREKNGITTILCEDCSNGI